MIFSRIPFVGVMTIIVIAFMSWGCASAAPQSDNSSEQNTARIIAIGDLHGDYEAYQSLLTQAGLIDKRGRWAGGKTIFVQTGDVADRGPDSRKIIEHLQKLQKQARKKGGQVIALLGNHEAMNMTNDLRYVHEGEYAAFRTGKSRRLRAKTYKANQDAIEDYYLNKDRTLLPDQIKENWETLNPLGKLEHQYAWSPKGDIGKWVTNNPAVLIIDDTLFVHGGVSHKYSNHSDEQINHLSKTALENLDDDDLSIIHDEWGPLWYRGFIPGQQRPDGNMMPIVDGMALTPEQELKSVLSAFGIKRMVVGHTPVLSGIKENYGGQLIQIDTGIAPHYGGSHSYLRIENGRVYAHDNGVVRELIEPVQ